MSGHKNEGCAGSWLFWSMDGGRREARCSTCGAICPADTLEQMRPFMEENYHGMLLLCAERGVKP